MKSEAQLRSFIAFCQEHPEFRFWQALRNWVGWQYVLVKYTILEVDTYYWEENFTVEQIKEAGYPDGKPRPAPASTKDPSK